MTNRSEPPTVIDWFQSRATIEIRGRGWKAGSLSRGGVTASASTTAFGRFCDSIQTELCFAKRARSSDGRTSLAFAVLAAPTKHVAMAAMESNFTRLGGNMPWFIAAPVPRSTAAHEVRSGATTRLARGRRDPTDTARTVDVRAPRPRSGRLM